jgi:hypothetical protein
MRRSSPKLGTVVPWRTTGRRLRLAGLAGLLALTAAGVEPSAPARDPLADIELLVVNRTGHGIIQLYISASSSDQWGDDRLAGETLAPGKSFRARLTRPPECRFDVQVIYDDATREESHGVDVCRNRQIAFDGSTAMIPPDVFTRQRQVMLVNRSGRPIQQVFVSPSAADQWGDDRLGEASISAGDARSVGYRGPCTADLRVVFDNRSAEERRGLDVCATPSLVIEPGWTTADKPPVPAATPSPQAGRMAIDVVNRSGRAVQQLYLFPEGGADQGRDLLGGTALPAGTRATVNLPRGDGCLYSAHVVPGGGAPDWNMTGIDLCHATVIELSPA